jgi:hypothetical protein
MKLTKEQLKQIIKEELEAVIENIGEAGYLLTRKPNGQIRQTFVSSLRNKLKPNQRFVPHGANEADLKAAERELDTGPAPTAVGNVRGPSAPNRVKSIAGDAPEVATEPSEPSETKGHRVKYPRTR